MSGWVWWSLVLSALRVILDVIFNLVIDEAFVILHMFGSFDGREANSVNVHGIGVL